TPPRRPSPGVRTRRSPGASSAPRAGAPPRSSAGPRPPGCSTEIYTFTHSARQPRRDGGSCDIRWRAMRNTLTLDRPDQLKALGHPLRVRTLELLSHEEDHALTNRELADRLGVDPGHLHFHVRMLL